MRIATLLAATALAGFVSGGPGTAHAAACGGTYTFSGFLDSCEIGADGYYDIAAYGAQGGAGGAGAQGGLGASAAGTFYLSAGTLLWLGVGQKGFDATMQSSNAPVTFGGGGGGGSFVMIPLDGTFLLAAGGGGGASGLGAAGQDGLATTWDTSKPYLASTEGLGGLGFSGAGGGGVGGSGANSEGGTAAGGGDQPDRNTAAGGNITPELFESQACTPGNGPNLSSTPGLGGSGGAFGGGGGMVGGGGGGGYTGGSNPVPYVLSSWSGWSECSPSGLQYRSRTVTTASEGGGGGSYVNGVSVDGSDVLVGGVRSGNGLISISLVQTVATDVPEPASMAVLGAALLGLGAARRRRG